MFLGSVLADDYGIGDDYHILTGDFSYYYDKGIIKANLSDKEFNSIPWAMRDAGDPAFITDLLRRFAYREGELGYAFGLGSYEMAKRWGAPSLDVMLQERSMGKAVAWNEASWFAPHHFEGQQVGFILNSMYNRDPCMHEQTHFNEFTPEIDKAVMAAVKGVDSGDAVETRWRAHADQRRQDQAGGPPVRRRRPAQLAVHAATAVAAPFFSPLKERGYRGDSGMDAREYSAITGDVKTEAQFVDTGLRIFNLMRALSIKFYGTKDMRSGHDKFPESGFNHKDWKGKPAFTTGCDRLDKADMEKALDMYYAAMGWDVATGAPTRATYEKYGLKYVADELAAKGLL